MTAAGYRRGAARRVGRARRLRTFALVVISTSSVLVLTAADAAARRPAPGPPPEVTQALTDAGSGRDPVLRGKVIEVIDGDSVEVQLQSGRIEVRLHAADAPEHDQPGGREAARALRRQLPRGSEVTLEPVEQDQYDRIVAVLERDGQNVNAWMVQQGHAWAYRQYTTDARYCRWEDAARSAHRGLWSGPPDAWIAPWDWRRRAREPGFRPADRSGETLASCLASLRHRRQKNIR